MEELSCTNALTNLQAFDLGNTQPNGDIGNLSALAKLQQPGMKGTEVMDVVCNLSALTNLLTLGIFSCLNALASLQYLHTLDLRLTLVLIYFKLVNRDLLGAQVTGAIGSRNNLASLQRLILCLRKTKVMGDIGSVGARTKLQQVGKKGTKVIGVIGSLSAPASLQTLSNPMLRAAAVTASPLVWSTRRSGALMPSEGVEVAGLLAGPSSSTMRSSATSRR